MILIISEENDQITNDVLDWLLLWKKSFLRINATDTINIRKISISVKDYDIKFSVNDKKKKYSIEQFSSIWFRRCDININVPACDYADLLSVEISSYLHGEKKHLEMFFIEQLEKIPNRIGRFHHVETNKMGNLIIASKCGLLIPETHIVFSYNQLDEIIKRNTYVSKAIGNGISIVKDGIFISGYTKLIKSCKNENYLFPSLIQKNIKKVIDLRIFYLRKKIWTTAIFSQNSRKTKIDFRIYDSKFPNRNEPFIIPNLLKQRIIKFMSKLNLDNGSLDFVISEDNKYYFLEVNPMGQFGAVAFESGYNISKVISKELIKPSINNKKNGTKTDYKK